MKRLFIASVIAGSCAWLAELIATSEAQFFANNLTSLTPLAVFILIAQFAALVCFLLSGIAIFIRGWQADTTSVVAKAERVENDEKASSGAGITAHSLLWGALAVELMVVGIVVGFIVRG